MYKTHTGGSILKLFKYGLVVLSLYITWSCTNIYLQLTTWSHSLVDNPSDLADNITSITSLHEFPTVNSHIKEVEYTIDLKSCPKTPPNLVGRIPVNLTEPESFEALPCVRTSVPPLMFGGRWKPEQCSSNSRLAVVMTHRNRTKNLKLMLQHLHPFLQKQQIEYQIFIIESPPDMEFNRGMLKNIGFLESGKYGNFTCVVFQDIDLLPENDKNLYHCTNKPKHLVIGIDTKNYIPHFGGAVFGGAVLFRTDQFLQVNGYSNLYFGWGVEDDDLLNRVKQSGLSIQRSNATVGRYTEANHTKSRKGATIPSMYRLRGKRFQIDGLNTLQYEVVKTINHRTYTWIHVMFNEMKYRSQANALVQEAKIAKNKQKEAEKISKNMTHSHVETKQLPTMTLKT